MSGVSDHLLFLPPLLLPLTYLYFVFINPVFSGFNFQLLVDLAKQEPVG